MSERYVVDFRGITDNRGILVPLESLKNVPFEIKRVYFLTSLKADYPRGFHAHKKLRQMAICLHGSCRFVMDDGHTKEELIIDRSDRGVIIEPYVWHEMHDFSPNCVLMVLASDFYDESDYIRKYEDFRSLIDTERR